MRLGVNLPGPFSASFNLNGSNKPVIPGWFVFVAIAPVAWILAVHYQPWFIVPLVLLVGLGVWYSRAVWVRLNDCTWKMRTMYIGLQLFKGLFISAFLPIFYALFLGESSS